MKRKKIVRMLKEMQKTVYNSDMFEKAGPQQKWIIENLLGNAIAELDGYPYAIGLKNKNLIESKVVHPESEYDYVDRFDDDEAELLNYDCRYSYSKPDLKESKKESKNISAEQKLMKKDAVKKEPFLITKEMVKIAMCSDTLKFETCAYNNVQCIECTVAEKYSFILHADERFLYEKNIYNQDVYSNEEKISIIYNQLLKDYKNDSLEDFEYIQNAIINSYKDSAAWDIFYEIIDDREIDVLKHLNFRVTLPECDLLDLYNRILWKTGRKMLITNMTICEDDALLSRYKTFLKNNGIESSRLKAVTGNEYEYDCKKFCNIFDGLFSNFIKEFEYDANDIHCICNMGRLDEYSDPKYADVDVMGELINAF